MLPDDTRKRLQVVNNVNPSIRQAATPASFLQNANVNPQGSTYNPQQQTFNPQQTVNFNTQSFAPSKPLSVGVSPYQALMVGGKAITPGPNLMATSSPRDNGFQDNYIRQTDTSSFGNYLKTNPIMKPITALGEGVVAPLQRAYGILAPTPVGYFIGGRPQDRYNQIANQVKGQLINKGISPDKAEQEAQNIRGQGAQEILNNAGFNNNDTKGTILRKSAGTFGQAGLTLAAPGVDSAIEGGVAKVAPGIIGRLAGKTLSGIGVMSGFNATGNMASDEFSAKNLGKAVKGGVIAGGVLGLGGGLLGEAFSALAKNKVLDKATATELSQIQDPGEIKDYLSKKLGVSPELLDDVSNKLAEASTPKEVKAVYSEFTRNIVDSAGQVQESHKTLVDTVANATTPGQVLEVIDQHYPNIEKTLGTDNVSSLVDALVKERNPKAVSSIIDQVDQRVSEANKQVAQATAAVTPAEQVSQEVKSQVPETAPVTPAESIRKEAIAQAGTGVPENVPVAPVPGEASATSVENTATGLADQTNANADAANIKEALDTTKVGTGDVGAKGRLKKFQELFSPVPGKAGEAVQSDLRASVGGLNAEKAAQFADSKQAIDFWKKTSDGDRLNFMQRIQSGEAQPTPDLQAAADYYAERFKQDAELATSINPNFVPIEDYFSKSGIWDNPDQASAFAKNWQATPDQFKHQAVPTIYDGIKAGLKLKESNPEIIAVNSRFQLLRAQMLQDFVDNQIARGVDPEIVSKMTDTWLQNQMGNGQLYNDVKSASYALSNMQLGLSGFHLTGTSINSALSRFANGLNDVLSGHPIKGVGEVATSPFAPVIDAFKGNSLRNAASAGEETIYTKLAREANFNLADQPEYRTSGLAKTVEDFQSGNKAKMAKGVAATPFRAFSTLSKPLMEWWVPNLKAGAFQDAVDTMLRQLGPEATEAEIRLGAQKVANSIDNRFGKLQQDNLLWDKTLKDGMSIMTRSPGWNIGTVREIGGGTANLFKKSTYTDLAAGKGLPASTTYTASLVAGTMMMGAAINYAFTGEAAKSVVDYFYPRTGKTDANGNPERVSLPTYAKDVVAFAHSPAQTVINKSTPLLGLTSQIISNKDYYGKHIRDTNSSNLEQLAQVGGYVGKSAMPFSITGGSQRVDTSPAARFQNFMGLTKAPGYVSGSNAATSGSGNTGKNSGAASFAPTGNPVTDAIVKQKTQEANNTKDFMDGLSKDDLKFFKAKVGGKNVDISQADLDRAHDGGAISDEDYARASALHQALNNVTQNKIPKVTKDNEGKFAAQFYQRVNAMTPDARKAYLEGAPDPQAKQAADILNKQLLPGLKTKVNPSNKITNLLANFNKDFSNNPDKTATQKRAGMRDLWKNVLKESAGDEVGRLITANENDIRYLINDGQVSKESMKAAINLDNEMLAAKLITTPNISNKLRRELGLGEYGSSGSGGSGGGSGGGRGGSRTTQLGLSQLLPKTLTFSQPGISTTAKIPTLNIGKFKPSDVRGTPRGGRAVSLRTSRTVIK